MSAFFTYAEGSRIAFEVTASLPPVCLKCGKHKPNIRWRTKRFSAARSQGANVLAAVGGIPAAVASVADNQWRRDVGKVDRTSARLPLCDACRVRRLLSFVALIGALAFAVLPWFDVGPLSGDSAFTIGFAAVICAGVFVYRTGLRSDRIDVENDGQTADVLRLTGVHRRARLAILDAADGTWTP